MRRIVKQPQAQRDVVNLGLYLKQRSANAARRFLDRTERAFAQLAEMPEMAGLFQTTSRALMGLRVWPIPRFRNYLIFFRPIPGGIEVVRVLHGAQDIEHLLESS